MFRDTDRYNNIEIEQHTPPRIPLLTINQSGGAEHPEPENLDSNNIIQTLAFSHKERGHKEKFQLVNK